MGSKPGGEPDTLGFTLDYVTLPILLKFVSGNRKTYVAGGLDIGFLSGAHISRDDESVDVKNSLKDIDLSADFAFGVMLPIGRPALTLEARYTQSILNVAGQQPDFVPGTLPAPSGPPASKFFGGVTYAVGRKSVIGSAVHRVRTAEPAGRASVSRRPSLAGHTFTPNDLVPDPFIKTLIRNSVGVGSAVDVEIPVAVIDGDTIIGFDGNLVLALLDFEYQHAVRDWLAARGGFRVQGRLGTNVGALLASGITASAGYEFGWLARLFQSDRILLSGEVKLDSNDFTFINLTDFVKDIIAGETARLVRSKPSIRGGGGPRFAWGLSRLFGVTAMAATGYGESVERDSEDQWYFDLGTTLDFDLLAVSPVPLGIVLGYKHDTFPEGGNDITDNIENGLLRMAFNGRPNFLVALDFTMQRFRSKQLERTVSFRAVGTNLRYYF